MLIEEDMEATKAKLAELHSVHRSLDKMIATLADSPVQDELERPDIRARETSGP